MHLILTLKHDSLTVIQEYEAVVDCPILHHDGHHIAVICQLIALNLTHLLGLESQFECLTFTQAMFDYSIHL